MVVTGTVTADMRILQQFFQPSNKLRIGQPFNKIGKIQYAVVQRNEFKVDPFYVVVALRFLHRSSGRRVFQHGPDNRSRWLIAASRQLRNLLVTAPEQPLQYSVLASPDLVIIVYKIRRIAFFPFLCIKMVEVGENPVISGLIAEPGQGLRNE